MKSIYSINLIFIFAVNVFFFFSGICLNSFVILSFWRSIQLRKKLCYFIIMVLSCCDLLAVLTNSLLLILFSMSWLTGKLDVNAKWPHISHMSSRSTTIFLGFFIIRSFGDEFRSIFGDILSYLSSNIGNSSLLAPIQRNTNELVISLPYGAPYDVSRWDKCDVIFGTFVA